MILFHGSDKIIERPMALFGRNKVDFGQGFYLTKKAWTKHLSVNITLMKVV